MFFTQSKRIIYALIVLTAVSWVSFGFIYSECLRFRVELDQTNIEYEVSQILLNQTRTKLDNATRSLGEANGTIEELSEERIEILKALLQHHDLDTKAWEDMGVRPQDLAFKADSDSYVHTFFMIYPSNLVTDEYADAILRICRQAKIEISKYFMPERFINRKILITMYPSIIPEYTMLAASPDHESIVMILSANDLTEYARNHVYGFIHEVAHFFAHFKGDINQGWAIYASTRVFWNVVNNLGSQVWPTPINATEDIEEVWKLINAEEDPYNRAANIFFDIDSLYGPEFICQVLRSLPATRIGPTTTWQELEQAFIQACGDPSIITRIFEKHGFKQV